MSKNYHALIPGYVFMGGANDVQSIVDNEGVKVVVDLREEAEQCAAVGEGLKWIKVPLGDEASEPQEQLLQTAIEAVTAAYKNGEKVAFHCGGGKGRTGTVAYGTLLELGLAGTIEDAEQQAQRIRSILNIKPAQRKSLEDLYNSNNS
ncbi:protein-tyrosine phosphatase family protein [Paenibacillus sp. Soil522]|uniref:protein-tyrosine phosphatase family protein n=1 Tax=Paenibacillus sp. Soil522 TaxID=1736388 RepID=UPI0006F3D616|nr:dual specificity protein phosphatase family protein [Paenibacillus sp. Soil522]KRE35208.1 protein tyrosine phosphatase [Paenibacillus sp. Soil522]